MYVVCTVYGAKCNIFYDNWFLVFYSAIAKIFNFPYSRTGSNGIDIEVSRHHAVSVSNFKSIKVSTDD